AEKIAGDLLQVFAAREVQKGHAYGVPDQYYKDFEAAFLYEETSDQLDAISDVFQDMKKRMPMDRLICGDVGYGKTEVALRASYMAVNDGKQVAVLVPTTVLAEQHYDTFSKRFKSYPVLISCLSRFRSRAEQRAIVEALQEGKTDVVIGTHRLLQKDVIFKDLGLIVIDEEQRFGVKHKEKLKKLRKTVDVLAMTATPIPRTLHMSLVGVRDISVINTPPEQRRSVVTYISEMDDVVIAEAIRKELARQGQIFFVHNNIHGIWKMAEHIKTLVPEVRLDVAHGRLPENRLEQVMLSFLRKEIDLLVCTSIIESGLDIPSANTILINRADRFGLAQVYQLRGRVGRAEEQAYAYLFVPKGGRLGRDAQKRLKVLMEHSDLGSGFQIAMRDLEIRGGGTILGASQSGHIAAVGYDMFLKLMKTAVSELKGEPVQEILEPEINLNLSAFIPESYIPNIDQRLSIYRRLARVDAFEEIYAFKSELLDRFGALPIEVTQLLLKMQLKILAAQACVKRLDVNGNNLLLHFSEIHLKDPGRVINLIQSNPAVYALTPDHILKVTLTSGQKRSIIKHAKKILKEVSERV
ncbi:MAG: DEAD/DEAH box helicase, partial [Planctomycetes bacterium]|nr:DEAD/DEAH box helicase [Planctomycetota bacterium]